MSDIISLIVLLVGVALSISALGWLNTRLGGWAPAHLDDLSEARKALEPDIIGFAGAKGAMSSDGRSAYVLEEGGARLGLVVAKGDRLVTRALCADEIRAIETQGETTHIMIKDWTLPSIEMRLGEDEQQDLMRFAPKKD